MDSLPTVAIVSSSNTKSTSLIKLLTKNTNISEDLENKGIITEQWGIDTKYYTAKVNLSALHSSYPRSTEFNENIEALIVLFDSNKSTGLSDLKTWEPLEADSNADVKLLVTNYCTTETKISRIKAMEWCLKRGFELIELYNIQPVPETEEEDDDIIKETSGLDRIVEALETHIWTNMDMKTKEQIKKSLKFSEQSPESSEGGAGIDKVLDQCITEEDNEDFAKLLSQLGMMKDCVQSLPAAERRQCAEQAVSAFWTAIGGDEEEIADLQ